MKNKPDIKVWIVEDNADFRSSLINLVDSFSGFLCERSFEKCESAIDYLERFEHPDIILCDIGLPGMSGIDGVKRFKEISADINIIILTVHDDHDKVFEAIQAGASGYLLKVATDEEIVDSLNQVIDGGAPMNARIARSVLEMFRKNIPVKTEYGLSEREEQILDLMVKGFTKPSIAEKVFLSPHTIDFHVRNIYSKLQVNSRQSAVAKAVRERLL